MRLPFCLRVVVPLILTISLQGQQAPPLPAKSVRLEVKDEPRPLAAIAAQLELKLGIPTTYEDAEWADPADLMTASDHPASRQHPLRDRLTMPIPRGGGLELDLQLESNGKVVNSPENLLDAALAAHVNRNNPGQFKKVKVGSDGFAIVPERARNQFGRFADQNSPFSGRISFPVAERTGDETLDLILRTVSNASGKRVVLGSGGLNLLDKVSIRLGANNEVARDVLALAFDTMQWSDARSLGELPRLSWSLLYGSDTKFWALNIHSVLQEIPSMGGATIHVPVNRH